jgi:hypothetical protein
MTTSRRVLACALLVALGLAACFRFLERARREPGSALWVAGEDAALSQDDRSRLEKQGLKELFVEAARLTWEGNRPRLRDLPLGDLPRRTPVTLAVGGGWSDAELDAGDAARQLTEELDRIRIAAESRGLLPVGFHLDLATPANLAGYAKVLSKVRSKLGRGLFLSATLERGRLKDEGARDVADALDFLVAFLYGQRPGEAEDPSAWDMESVEGNVRALEGLGRPYMIGVITLGGAVHRARDGRNLAVTTRLDLGSLVANPRFELKPGFSLEGVDRQIFEFVAKGETLAGEWTVHPGESVRIVRTATPLVEELLRRVGAWNSPQHLGEVYYRLAAPGERLSLSIANLVNTLAPDAAVPELDLRLELRFRSDRVWIVRAELRNTGEEATDLSFFDSNYLQLTVDGATFGDVDLGQFARYEVLWHGTEKNTMRAMREGDTLRLFRPLVEGGDHVVSGDIEIRLRRAQPTLEVGANFLLPDGRVLAPEVREWTFENP